MDKSGEKLFQSALLSMLVLFSGCAMVRVTDPEKTATQQYLTSEAVAKAIEQLSFDILRGRTVYIDNSYLDEAEQRFATAEFRATVLQAGAYVIDNRGAAEIIVEMRSNGIGIDRYESLLGIPSLGGPAAAAPGAPPGAQSIVTPELAITKNLRQHGFASLSYVAFWADSGEIVTHSGPFVGQTYRQDWWFLGFGPRTIGNVPVVEPVLD